MRATATHQPRSDTTEVGRAPLPLALLFLAVALVPFQQALTVSVGFPLKASEVLGVLGVVLAALTVQRPQTPGATYARETVFVLGLFVLLSTGFQLLFRNDLSPNSEMYPRGLEADVVLYAGYALLALTVGVSTARLLPPDLIAKAFSVGIRLTALFCIAQLVILYAGGAQLLTAINSEIQVGTTYGIQIPRNGPFNEGNYLGFYSGVALFICARRRDRVGMVLALACILYAQSTGALVSLAAALVGSVFLRPSNRTIGALSGAATLGMFAVIFIGAIQDFARRQLAKLGLGSQDGFGASIDYSRRSRTINADTGFAMMQDNPVLGLGPGRYGYWYDTYLDRTDLPSNFNPGIVRPIANNAYAQIGAELGVFALVAFGLLFVLIALRVRLGRASDLMLTIFVAVGVIATPAWTVLPIWFAVAYLSSVCMERGREKVDIHG